MSLVQLTRGEPPTLICLPFSGGAGISFLPLVRQLEPIRSVLAVDPPGHGGNAAPALRDFEALVDFYLETLVPVLRDPYVLFGHSLGGFCAYRLAQILEREHTPPAALVISGAAPRRSREGRTWAEKEDDEILEDLRAFGGTDPSLLAKADFVSRLIRTVRADADVIQSIRDVDDASIAAPTHLFAGRHDPEAPPEAVAAWSTRLQHARIQVFEGPHMFILTDAESVGAALSDVLLESAYPT